MFNAFVKQRVREVIAYRELNFDAAIQFLKENKHGIIKDEHGDTFTQEELEYAKTIKSKVRNEPDNTPSSGDPVSEDSYRELFGFIADRAEPSTDGDN